MPPLRPLVAVALLALVGACGVPVQREPVTVAGVALPSDPMPGDADTEGRPGEPAQPVVEVFLVRANRLNVRERQVAVRTLDAAVRELFEGPTRDDAAAGIRSAIPPGAVLRAARIAGTVATLDVSSPFLDVTGEEQILAVAQVVFTATALEGIEAIRLLVGSEPVEVPRGDGTLAPVPVSPADYPALAPAS